MRFSDLFGRTLRHAAANEGPGSALAERCALLRFSDGSVVQLPLGARVVRKMADGLWDLVPEAQKILLPPGKDASCWDDILRMEVQSYRQLPLSLYCERRLLNPVPSLAMIKPKWTHALQWMWVKATAEASQSTLQSWEDAAFDRLNSWGLRLAVVDGTGGRKRWFFEHEGGSEKIFACGGCGYRAQDAAAQFERGSALEAGAQKEVKTVATPDADTIEALAAFLEIEKSSTLKAVFLTAEEVGLVLVVLRGDLEISLPKLQSLLGVEDFKAADERDIREAGMVPGYAGPVGLKVRKRMSDPGVLVVGDLSISGLSSIATGANKLGYHLVGVSYPRDFSVTVLGDLAQAFVGAFCAHCADRLEVARGFTLGEWGVYDLDLHFASESGNEVRASSTMATIALEPLLAAMIETFGDEKGLAWPPGLAPFQVGLIDLKSPQEGGALYRALRAEGIEVLYDDRELSAGVKFTDADLLGLPIRVTVGSRSLQKGGAEVSFRRGEGMEIIALEEVVAAVQHRLSQIM